jgi:hypothetical protein
MKSAYISCPMTIPQSILSDVIRLVEYYDVKPQWWTKGAVYNEHYFSDLIKNTDAFIVILPDLAWSYEGYKMTSGSRKELIIAVKAKRPIYLAYKNKNDGLGIYAANVITSVSDNSGEYIPDIIINGVYGVESTRYNFRDIMSAPTYIQKEGKVERLPNTSEKMAARQKGLNESLAVHKVYESTFGKNLNKLAEEINSEKKRRGWQQLRTEMDKAGYSVPYPKAVDYEGFMKQLEQSGILVLDRTNKIDKVDNRILLFL